MIPSCEHVSAALRMAGRAAWRIRREWRCVWLRDVSGLRYGIACVFLVSDGGCSAADVRCWRLRIPMRRRLPVPPLRPAKGRGFADARSGRRRMVHAGAVRVAFRSVVFGLRAAGGLSLVMSRLSVRIRRRSGCARPCSGSRAIFGLDKLVPVFTSARVSVPIVFGVLRPMIVLPCSA